METITFDPAWDSKILITKKPHQKYILKSGEAVPGCTTVLGELGKQALIHWAWDLGMKGIDYRTVRDGAADVGTAAHFICECWLKKLNPVFEDLDNETIEKAHKSFDKFQAFWEESGFTIVESEVQLVSEEHGFGGTIDCIIENQQNDLIILDIKTTKSLYLDSMIPQISAYSSLWNETRSKKLKGHILLRIGKELATDHEVFHISDAMIEEGMKIFMSCLSVNKAKKKLKLLTQ